MAGVKSEIGETLNVFHDAANVLRAGDCVISAHGVRAIHPRDFIVPQGVTIHFYVPKGYTGVALKSYTIDDDVSRDGPSMSVALGDSYPTPVQPATVMRQ